MWKIKKNFWLLSLKSCLSKSLNSLFPIAKIQLKHILNSVFICTFVFGNFWTCISYLTIVWLHVNYYALRVIGKKLAYLVFYFYNSQSLKLPKINNSSINAIAPKTEIAAIAPGSREAFGRACGSAANTTLLVVVV